MRILALECGMRLKRLVGNFSRRLANRNGGSCGRLTEDDAWNSAITALVEGG